MPYTFFSYNIDTNIVRIEGEHSIARLTHPQWRANRRAKALQETIDSAGRADIIHIQEARVFNTIDGTVDSVTPMVDFLHASGYEVLVKDENEGETSFKYITAYDPNKFSCKISYSRYFNREPNNLTPRHVMTPEQTKEYNYGAEWEKSCFIVLLEEKISKKIFGSMNYHFGLADRVREESSKLVVKFAEEIKVEYPEAVLVAMGDANTLPDNPATEKQLSIFRSFFHESTSALLFPNGSPADFSYIPFPYDPIVQGKPVNKAAELSALSAEERLQEINRFYAENSLAATGLLDRMLLSHDFDPEKTITTVKIYPLYGDLGGYTEPEIKEYIVSNLDRGPAFASDHQLVCVKTELKKV
jgi:hypothetical protein